MSWNVQQFRFLLQNKRIPYPKVYVEALDFKIWSAGYHARESRRVWEELSLDTNEIVLGNASWNEAYLKAESHIMCSAQAVHTLGDIMAQIINATFVPSPLSEGDVSLRRIRDRIPDQDVLQAVNDLVQSAEFTYLNAFVNTIKHRRLVDTEYRGVFGIGMRNEHGIRFCSFSYSGMTFPATWGSDITGAYRERIVHLVCSIGVALNNSLEQTSSGLSMTL